MTSAQPAKSGKNLFTAALVLLFCFLCFSSPVLAKGNTATYKGLKTFSDVLDEISSNYVDEVQTEELIQKAIRGMVGGLDPHSDFLPPEAFEELQIDTKGEFGGIGIVLSGTQEGLFIVIAPIEGTPAYKAGILAEDMIIAVDGESTKGMMLWEVVKKMRGPKGEKVVVTVARKGVPDPIEFKLVRDMIPMDSVRYAQLKPDYGYIWITNFRETTTEDLKKALAGLKKRGPIKGLVLDLRSNPGGLLDQALSVTDLFLKEGEIVSIKGRKTGDAQVFSASKRGTELDYPIVALINSGSASASEIVAGALQDHKRALILGTTSFGKGSVQTVRPLKDGYALKYTIARYYTPSGRSIQATGIEPDIVVPYRVLEEKNDEKAFLHEKDLKNHIENENTTRKKDKKETEPFVSKGLDLEKLLQDQQVQRALDILIGHNILEK